jgi:Na+-transporting NADH:ubiquinone oxidoreductase subunit NqrD
MTEWFARFFRGIPSPLSLLAGAGLLFMATTRTAFAVVTLGALVWTWTLAALVRTLAAKLLPRRGTTVVILGVVSGLAALYLLALSLLDPVLAWESALCITLVPLVCHFSALPERVRDMECRAALLQSFLEALGYGAPLLVTAVLREFLGTGLISLPGREGGLFALAGRDCPYPASLRILETSAGVFLLLGYGAALFRYVRSRRGEKP